jgi:hypothetical protein
MADDRVIQIAVSPGTQEFPDEVYLLCKRCLSPILQRAA